MSIEEVRCVLDDFRTLATGADVDLTVSLPMGPAPPCRRGEVDAREGTVDTPSNARKGTAGTFIATRAGATAGVADGNAGTIADGARVGLVPAGEAAGTAAIGGVEHAVGTLGNAGAESSQGSEGTAAASGLSVAYGSRAVTMAEPPWESEVPQGARAPPP